jgi:hypothetical protein
MLAEVESIALRKRVDCVYAPIWDCEGLAVLLEKRFPPTNQLANDAAVLAKEQSR